MNTNRAERADFNGRPTRSLRIAMYSHDTMGLGHMRRNLLLAQALAGAPHEATILLIAGACEIGGFRLPGGVDFLSLPALEKCGRSYQPRRLAVPLSELTELRQRTIQTALEVFSPDILLVDNVPRGALGELTPALCALAEDPAARCVLGLRDILDDAETIRGEWRQTLAEEAICQYYDAVCIYGDQNFFDHAAEYCYSPEVVNRMTYLGYLDQSLRLQSMFAEPRLEALRQPYAACVVGGGRDGFQLAQTFLRTVGCDRLARVVVAGPCMEHEEIERLRRLAHDLGRGVILEFPVEADAIIRGAERVVGMGGYNTLCAILGYAKPALIVPRVRPRCEQWMRAQRLHARGLLDVLHPDVLSPEALGDWLNRDIDSRKPHPFLDFGGLDKLSPFLSDVRERPRLALRHHSPRARLEYAET